MVAPVDIREAVRGLIRNTDQERADPYSVYRELRENYPVFISDSTAWLTRHEDVEAGFRDSTNLSNQRLRGIRFNLLREHLSAESKVMLDKLTDDDSLLVGRQDGMAHKRLRDFLQQALTPQRMAALEPFIKELVDSLLDRMADAPSADLIAAAAFELPLRVIDELMGVPDDEQQIVRELAQAATFSEQLYIYPERAESLIAEIYANHNRFRDYVQTIIERARQAGSKSSLVTALIGAEASGQQLSDAEIYSMLTNILFAGHETTAKLIGNSVYSLLTNLEQWDMIAADRSLIPNAIEELLRYQPPVQSIDRLAPSPIEIRGVTIPAGQTVRLCIGAACRDPQQYTDPDRLDITRTPGRTVVFGLGPHFCVGAPLARLESRVFLTSLFDRFPRMRLAEGFVPDWTSASSLRGLKRLDVDLGLDTIAQTLLTTPEVPWKG
jgi:cytochrome P450